MANHINEFNTLISQANSMGMTQNDENKVVLLLCSLPSSWDEVVTIVSTSVSDKNKLVFDDVATTPLSEDLRRKNEEPSSGEALTVVSIDNRGRSHKRSRNNHNRRSKSARRLKSKGRNGDCWFCGKSCHQRKYCRNYERAQEKVRDNEANTVYDKEDSVLVFSTVDITSDSWVLDSKTSYHATSCMEAFMNYHKGQFKNVFLGDNKACEIVGKGDVLLPLEGGKTWLLKDVRHVPK